MSDAPFILKSIVADWWDCGQSLPCDECGDGLDMERCSVGMYIPKDCPYKKTCATKHRCQGVCGKGIDLNIKLGVY